MSPLVDFTDITLFADDNYAVVWNNNMDSLKVDVQTKLQLITTWLKHSGLKVNEGKTEMCLFHRKDNPPVTIIFSNKNLTSKSYMNVLGVTFDSKLNWQIQVPSAITKNKSSFHAIKLISKYFKKYENLQLLTSNFYLVLYYNSEIWHLPTLSHN